MRYLIVAAICLKLALPHSVSALSGLSEDATRLKALYEELQGFKNDPEFHEGGFGNCCKFKAWLKEVEKLDDEDTMHFLIEVGFVPGDLRMLGMEYMKSGGRTTEYTEFMEAVIADGFE